MTESMPVVRVGPLTAHGSSRLRFMPMSSSPPGSEDPPGSPGRYESGDPQAGQYGGAGQPHPGQYGQGQYPGPYGQDQYGEDQYGQGQYGQDRYPAGTSGPGPVDPLVPTSLSEWASRVVAVVARSWQPLLVIQLVAALPGLLLGGLLGMAAPDPATGAAPTPEMLGLSAVGVVGGLVALVFSLFAQGASVYVVVRNAVGRPVRAGEALSFAGGRALPLLGWSLLAGLLVALGFVALVLPGIYLAAVFTAALTGVIMIERKGIGRTFQLVNPRFLATFGRLALAFLAAIAYVVVVGLVLAFLAAPDSLAFTVLNAVLTLPVSLAAVGVGVVTYAELRRKENPAVTAYVLANEMER